MTPELRGVLEAQRASTDAIQRKNAKRWLPIGLVLPIASGCARSDWIEGTLVTVDITGQWTGAWSGDAGSGQFALTLRQAGPKATREVTLIGWYAHTWNGDIVGTITGDVLSFARPDARLRGEVIVAGDEMSRTITFTPVTASGCCPGGIRSERRRSGFSGIHRCRHGE